MWIDHSSETVPERRNRVLNPIIVETVLRISRYIDKGVRQLAYQAAVTILLRRAGPAHPIAGDAPSIPF